NRKRSGVRLQVEQFFSISPEDEFHVSFRKSGFLDIVHPADECLIDPERIICSEQEAIRADRFLRAPQRPWMRIHGVVPEKLCLNAGRRCGKRKEAMLQLVQASHQERSKSAQ